jgi:hypothetical protein
MIFWQENDASYSQMNDLFFKLPLTGSDGFRLLMTSIGPLFFPQPEPFGTGGAIRCGYQLEKLAPLLLFQKIMATAPNDKLVLHLVGVVVAAEKKCLSQGGLEGLIGGSGGRMG